MSIYKLDWYTLMYNEEDIIPYIHDYWQKLRDSGIDLHVYIYDNYSTDNSVKLLQDIPWITIRQFHSDGQNDIIQAQIKNSCWKDSKADFVCVSDFDEVLWGDLAEELEVMKQNGYNVMGTKWYAFCGDEKPTYTPGMFLHQLVSFFYISFSLEYHCICFSIRIYRHVFSQMECTFNLIQFRSITLCQRVYVM